MFWLHYMANDSVCVCVCALSCLTLCDYMGPPGSSVQGIFPARVLEWVAISSSRRSSQPRDLTLFSYIGGWILYQCHHLESMKVLKTVDFELIKNWMIPDEPDLTRRKSLKGTEVVLLTLRNKQPCVVAHGEMLSLVAEGSLQEELNSASYCIRLEKNLSSRKEHSPTNTMMNPHENLSREHS